jgi:hypothetical protein
MPTLKETVTTLFDKCANMYGLDRLGQLCPIFGGTNMRLDSVPVSRLGDFGKLLEQMANPESIARAQAVFASIDEVNSEALGHRVKRAPAPHNSAGFERAPIEDEPEPTTLATLDSAAIWAKFNKAK